MKKEFCCTCVNPIWRSNDLGTIIDNATDITKRTFLKNCEVDKTTIGMMKEYPYDFSYYKNMSIYFYTHSCIEHFYK